MTVWHTVSLTLRMLTVLTAVWLSLTPAAAVDRRNGRNVVISVIGTVAVLTVGCAVSLTIGRNAVGLAGRRRCVLAVRRRTAGHTLR